MKVVIAESAQGQVRARRAWWRKQRDHRQVFDEELIEARRILEGAPMLAIHGTREGRQVRRLALSRVHCYVYFTIDEASGVVEIVSLWGQEMASQPEFVDEK